MWPCHASTILKSSKTVPLIYSHWMSNAKYLAWGRADDKNQHSHTYDFLVRQADFISHLPDRQAQSKHFVACCWLNFGRVQNSFQASRTKVQVAWRVNLIFFKPSPGDGLWMDCDSLKRQFSRMLPYETTNNKYMYCTVLIVSFVKMLMSTFISAIVIASSFAWSLEATDELASPP